MFATVRVIRGGNRVLEVKALAVTVEGQRWEVELTGEITFPAEVPIPRMRVEYVDTKIKGGEEVVHTPTRDVHPSAKFVIKKGDNVIAFGQDEAITMEWENP